MTLSRATPRKSLIMAAAEKISLFAPGVKMAFVQHGYDHQFSYKHPWTRWALLHSIVQIDHNAQEPIC